MSEGEKSPARQDGPARGGRASRDAHDLAAGVMSRREVFWHNVLREMLNALAAAAASSGGRLKASAGGAAMSAQPTEDIFDGRVAVITKLGQRVPIADIFPVFACSVSGTSHDRMLSADVQCSVFQIRTPGGEVYTLPVHEIVAIHSLSEELLMKMEEAAESVGDVDEDKKRPFGFAAYTSLAKAEREAREARDGADEAANND